MKNGLKGVTDATVFCKSMQKGGPKPMIRDMRSYEVGGTTGLQATDTAKPPRWLRDIGTDIKRGIRKIKNNMQINSYQNSKSKNTKSKSPGGGNYNKLRNQQKSQNNKCTGGKGCVGQ